MKVTKKPDKTKLFAEFIYWKLNNWCHNVSFLGYKDFILLESPATYENSYTDYYVYYIDSKSGNVFYKKSLCDMKEIKLLWTPEKGIIK